MIDFRKIKIEDKDWINNCLAISDFRGCEYVFGNNLAWNRLNDTEIAKYKDFYICRSYAEGEPYITFPAGVKTDNVAGREKYIQLFSELKEMCISKGHKLVITSVTKSNLEWIQNYYGSKINETLDRDNSDYIYNSEDLINLSGKKYHGKRNHIKHFEQSEWSFEECGKEYADECISFAAEFYNNKNGYEDFSAVVEQYAINKYFEYFDVLDIKLGILRQDNKIVGFSLGERINSDTFDVHIEKAKADIDGAYPKLCNCFAKAYAGEYKYINREEDLGIEGLRKSKESYRPVFLHDKYTVEFL